jgi:hypothetical protein
MIIPLNLGRLLCRIMFLPPFLIHDPLNFLMGIFLVQYIVTWYQKLPMITWQQTIQKIIINRSNILMSGKYYYYYDYYYINHVYI